MIFLITDKIQRPEFELYFRYSFFFIYHGNDQAGYIVGDEFDRAE